MWKRPSVMSPGLFLLCYAYFHTAVLGPSFVRRIRHDRFCVRIPVCHRGGQTAFCEG